MKKLEYLLILSSVLLAGVDGFAQSENYDAFVPIAKYISQGNAENLSAWFADNLEISVLATGGDSSKSQAKQIVKSFFEAHTPRAFDISHTVEKSGMQYALGTLNAGGEQFQVTIFISPCGGGYKIQQLKIERQQ